MELFFNASVFELDRGDEYLSVELLSFTWGSLCRSRSFLGVTKIGEPEGRGVQGPVLVLGILFFRFSFDL